MQKMYLGWFVAEYKFATHHPLVLLLAKFWSLWIFFLGPLFSIPFLAVCFVLPYGFSFRQLRPGTKVLVLACISISIATVLPVGYNPHYLGPAVCALYALVLIAMSKVRHWRPRQLFSGIAIVRFVPVIAILVMLLHLVCPRISASENPKSWASPVFFDTFRETVLHDLLRKLGMHLILVRYRPDHDPRNEWVYNGADIDHSRVVWARDMGPEQNEELVRYFKDRKVWVVEPDILPPKLSPYVAGQDEIKMSSSAHQRGAR